MIFKVKMARRMIHRYTQIVDVASNILRTWINYRMTKQRTRIKPQLKSSSTLPCRAVPRLAPPRLALEIDKQSLPRHAEPGPALPRLALPSLGNEQTIPASPSLAQPHPARHSLAAPCRAAPRRVSPCFARPRLAMPRRAELLVGRDCFATVQKFFELGEPRI